jgi:hypothetical protein
VHYNETYHASVSRSESPNTAYDAFYLVALATYASNEAPMTGEKLSGAVARLVPPGARVDVGPTGILTAFGLLQNGEKLDLNGTTGRMDFDLATGDAPVDFAIVCADVDATGKAVAGLESGVVYDPSTERLSGPLACP